MKHEKTFDAIAKLKDIEVELHRLKNALEMANRALDAKDKPVACKECHLKDTVYELLDDLKVANLKLSVQSQRTWVGLTNDEVNEFAAGCHLGNSVQGAIYKAEAKLKELNA